MKRICVLGISGSGKTTFAQKLSKTNNLPLHHMDQLFWGENWTAILDEQWQNQECAITQQEKWIIEGYIDSNHCKRLNASDLIIFLDYSGLRCALNGLKRWWTYKNNTRPEMAKNCIETLNLKFIWTMLRRKERHEIIQSLETTDSIKKTVIMKHSKDAQNWLRSL